MKKLDITKPITTRDGRPVTNVCADADGRLWGLVDGYMRCAASDGYAVNCPFPTEDWINKPETHDITVYVYKNIDGILWWALRYIDGTKLFAKFTKTIKEGEGLDGIVDK